MNLAKNWTYTCTILHNLRGAANSIVSFVKFLIPAALGYIKCGILFCLLLPPRINYEYNDNDDDDKVHFNGSFLYSKIVRILIVLNISVFCFLPLVDNAILHKMQLNFLFYCLNEIIVGFFDFIVTAKIGQTTNK